MQKGSRNIPLINDITKRFLISTKGSVYETYITLNHLCSPILKVYRPRLSDGKQQKLKVYDSTTVKLHFKLYEQRLTSWHLCKAQAKRGNVYSHIKIDRESDRTQETWIIIQGSVKTKIFDLDDQLIV